MAKANLPNFLPLNVAVLTISDTRNLETDTSGYFLERSLIEQGHNFQGRNISKDDISEIQANLKNFLTQNIDIIITTGGTGFTKRDNTQEAIKPLIERHIEGFGELFRYLSYQDIATSSLQSSAFAGFIKNTIIFSLPGSENAVKLAWQEILIKQLDSTTKPCNFSALLHLEYKKNG